MFRLLYISTVRKDFDHRLLEDILAKSRRANRANGLTGLLLFDGNRFLQYLEGDETVVRAVYGKIKNDPRHFAVVTLRESSGEKRQFSQWDMARFSKISPAEFDEQVERVSSFVENCDVLTAAELKGFVNKLTA
jgi:hypothetical protein